MSSSPATTWAAVTTSLGATTQPLPSTPSPQAVPSTRTTLGAARRTPGCRSTRGSSGRVGTGGPVRLWNGSIRPSAFRIVLGGTISFRRCSTTDRCTERRSCAWPGSWSAIAPSTQTATRPTSAPVSTPNAESTARRFRRSRLLSAAPSELPTTSNRTASETAPTTAITGAYGELEPSDSRTGASRAPRSAPTTRPASESPLHTKPCAAPPSAASTTNATASQSTMVTTVRLRTLDGPELQEFIDRYNAAWNGHDVETIVSMHTEDSVFENHVTGDVNVGREKIGRAIEGIFSVFPDLSFEGRRTYIREDLVVQEWTARGTHEGTMTRSGMEVPPTGRKVDYRGMDVIPIRDGLVARKDVYSDSVTLLRQLGLTEIA